MGKIPTTSPPSSIETSSVFAQDGPGFKVVLISTYELGRQPFGLASPAAWLRNAGIDVTQVDTSIDPFPEDAVRASDLVAFYVPMHTATRLAVPLALRSKDLNPDIQICFYGLYAPMNERMLKEVGAIAVLGGEFESDLLALCRQLSVGDAPSVPSISLNLQDFLPPDRSDLPPLGSYARLFDGREQRKVGYTEASRGCKHLCRHCPVVPVYQGRFRVVQPDVVLEDVRRQVRAGAEHITFGDPDFLNGPGHAIPLVKRLHDEFPSLTYDITAKIEHLLLHEQHLPVLKETGCAIVTSAVESLDDDLLALLEKGHTREDFHRLIELFNVHGLVLNPTFIPFTPWTTLDGYTDFLRTLRSLDLTEHVAPIQLAIRLLIPDGSRLLELAAVRDLVEEFDSEKLSYTWIHMDPEVDRLHESVMGMVCEAQTAERSRTSLFEQVWGVVNLLTNDSPLPEDTSPAVSPVTIPYLTEPWYC